MRISVWISDVCSSDLSYFPLRFFVPGHEMERCGHATLGTLWLMRQAGVIGDRRVRIRTRSGIVFADTKAGNIRLSQPAATVRALEPPECRRVLNGLGLRDDMLANPLFCNASTSRPKTLIPLASVASLHRLQPRFTEMEALCDAIESTGLYPFARVTAAGLAFEARQFPKASGYPEDAATGIAATALTGALAFFGIDVAPGATVTIIQGRAMGRASRLPVMRGEAFHQIGRESCRERVGQDV